MKKVSMVVVVTIAVFACLLLCMPVSAPGNPGAGCPSETKFYGTINGGVYLEQQGWAQFNSMTRTFDNVPEGIKIARIYTGIWEGSPSKGGKFDITIVNATSSYTTTTYQACDPCPVAPCASYQSDRCDALNWSPGNVPPNVPSGDVHDYIVGCGVQFVSFNATPYITPGSNTITVRNSCCDSCTCWDGRIYLIALLVVYENSSMPEMTYWVNEGAPYLEVGSYCDGPDDHFYASIYFDGMHVSTPAKVKLWTLGWPYVINADTKLNDNDIGEPDITESHAGGWNEVLLRWNNISTSYLNQSSNLLEFYDPAPYYERAFASVLMVAGPTGPDLTVTKEDIELPAMMRPGKDYMITATIKNEGGEGTGVAFNVSLAVDGTPYAKEEGVGPLAAGESTTVSFTVNLAKGCHEFKVVADANSDVSESNEYNNEGKKKKQAGNVIVVNSNSDFDNLVSEGFATTDGTTYYIEDLDIENCEGRGIDIQNTNVPFVINNCTVHDCSESGVFFKSITNGKISDSTVEKNHLKGIRLRNCSHVDIDNNLVQENAKYGIDVFPSLMPYPDCEYICITNNTVIGNLYGIDLIGDHCVVRDNVIRNNTAAMPGSDEGHGIYCFGNYSKIYNNTIAYNDNYGIYMDYDTPSHPCLWNCIFGNTFIDNNVQFSDHIAQCYDSGDNYWNSTVPLGYYNDTGSLFDNYMGNYWRDYTQSYPDAEEVDGSEIWDTPYDIDGGTNKDYAPLMQPWSNYERIPCDGAGAIFDTGSSANPYPSIFGTHNGTITVNQNITVNGMYTYPCSGTGGHTEFAKIWNETTGDCAEAHWNGYPGDYHNISFNKTLTLKKGVVYHYIINTGSYPQIYHTDALPTTNGWINCTEFTDANGKRYTDWIPAIRLFL
ncbi:MAG: DUF3344 domain-containing protein [Candidatus Syntrophoarchaeum sp.]|nr:DUF3344 domain-containing protein [Candidatus Syntrophoarchaeum sp.]